MHDWLGGSKVYGQGAIDLGDIREQSGIIWGCDRLLQHSLLNPLGTLPKGPSFYTVLQILYLKNLHTNTTRKTTKHGALSVKQCGI
jgi:hypothetical protein